MSKLIKLQQNYKKSLERTFFQGDWAEEPNFSKEDYEKYISWLNKLKPIESLDLDYKQAVLIGANKIFASFLYTVGTNKHKHIYPIGLMFQDNTLICTKLPLDEDRNSHKNLYVQKKLENPIVIRAVSTSGLEKYPLKMILSSGQKKDLIANKSTLESLLKGFQEFHKFMEE
ncbi:MAG: hypothetical protein KKF52_03950 [Nanoarchaeota archaeon]|nr:hypothetical protein [Nanoarchaeota archaeon]MBU4352732.1 hypothetical protein [Nanoarchaeota archaeon]